jgi:hypothetical protein
MQHEIKPERASLGKSRSVESILREEYCKRSKVQQKNKGKDKGILEENGNDDLRVLIYL